MKAAVLVEQGQPLEVIDLIPHGLDVGQVLVDVKVAGVCGAQIREIDGTRGSDPYLPHCLGHEGVGLVVQCGPGVQTVEEGDYVVLHWRKGAGIDADPPRYTTAGCGTPVGAGPVATWAETIVASENRMTRIDKDIPWAQAVLLGCGVTTGLGIALREAPVCPGKRVLVIGVGGVGINVVQGYLMRGCGVEVYVKDLNEDRIALAEKLGACAVPHDWDIQNYDAVVECTGSPEMIPHAFSLTAPGGVLVLVGQPPAGAGVTFPDFGQHYCGKRVIDSQGGGTVPQDDIPLYVNLWRDGFLELDSLVGKTFPLRQVNEAIAWHKAGHLGRTMLKVEGY